MTKDRRNQAGLVGKMTVVWLLFVALLAVVALDVVSIGRSTYSLSAIAAEAASDGAVVFRSEGRDPAETCEAVAISVEAQAPALRLGRNFCRVDSDTGRVTVTLRVVADTIIADRLGVTRPYTQILVMETNGPSQV